MTITLILIKKKEKKILGWMGLGGGGGPKVFDKNCQQFKVTIHVK